MAGSSFIFGSDIEQITTKILLLHSLLKDFQPFIAITSDVLHFQNCLVF